MNEKPSIFERVWHNPSIKAYTTLALFAAMALPGAAHASTNTLTTGGWNKLGSNMAKTFCGFLESPIITIVVAVGALALFIVAAMNEDNGTMSKLLKVLGFGMAMLAIPGILPLLGFGRIC